MHIEINKRQDDDIWTIIFSSSDDSLSYYFNFLLSKNYTALNFEELDCLIDFLILLRNHDYKYEEMEHG